MATINFITAYEAKLISQDYQQENSDFEFVMELDSKIKLASQKGYNFIQIEHKNEFSWYIKEFLKNNGYELEENIFCVTIRW